MSNKLHYRLIAPLLVASLLVNSCKNDNCNNPIAFNYDPEGTSTENCVYAPRQVAFHVSPVFGGNAFNVGDTLAMDGRKLALSYFGVYLSNLSFVEGDDTKQWSDHVVLVRNGALDTTTLYLNKSDITALRFDVGVDTSIYTTDPLTLPEDHALAPKVPSMYWGWAMGHTFIAIEGKVDTSAAKDGSGWASFGFHCGLPANLHSVELNMPDGVSTQGQINIALTMDVATMLKGIDFTSTDLMVHEGAHATTIKVAENAQNAFAID